jgi:hypothetical protein
MLDRVGAQGRSRVGDFAIDAMARRLADYYEQLLSRRGQRRSNVAVVSVGGDTDRVEVAR